MNIGDVYYEKHTVVGISKRTGTVSETDVEIVNMLPIDVLDKIRAEIESQRKEVSKKQSEDEGLSNYYFGLNDGLKDARDILDKYKAESMEVEE